MFKINVTTFTVVPNLIAKINIYVINAVTIKISLGDIAKEIFLGFITKFNIFEINADNIKSGLEYSMKIFNMF